MNNYFVIKASAVILSALLACISLSACVQSDADGATFTTVDPLPDSRKVSSTVFGDFNVDIYKDYAEITKYNGKDKSVTIPDEISGVPTMSIGTEAFAANKTLESIVISDRVLNIDTQAFYQCSSLKNVTMHAVIEIGIEAFRYTAIEDITLPETLQNLGKYSFGDTPLISVTMPESIVFVGDYAFAGCDSLTSFEIKKANGKITTRMFSGCDSLTDVTVSDNISAIEDYAFAACKNLKTIYIPETVTSIGFGIFYESNNVTIKTTAGSAAEDFARKNSIPFETVEKQK